MVPQVKWAAKLVSVLSANCHPKLHGHHTRTRHGLVATTERFVPWLVMHCWRLQRQRRAKQQHKQHTIMEQTTTPAAAAPAQVAASELFTRLPGCEDLVPVHTVLLMAEHALDRLEASPAQAALLPALVFTVGVLASDGVWQQLEPEKATSLGIRTLQQFGAPLLLCACLPAPVTYLDQLYQPS
jgi:hypothetical protein